MNEFTSSITQLRILKQKYDGIIFVVLYKKTFNLYKNDIDFVHLRYTDINSKYYES